MQKILQVSAEEYIGSNKRYEKSNEKRFLLIKKDTKNKDLKKGLRFQKASANRHEILRRGRRISNI